MGQGNSSPSSSSRTTSSSGDPSLTDAMGLLRSQVIDVARLTTLTWDDFSRHVIALNDKCRAVVDHNGKYLLFAIKKGSADSYLWKATVRVCCLKMNSETRKVESRKLLTLLQFLRLHKSLLALIEQTAVSSENSCSAAETSIKTVDLTDITTSVLMKTTGLDCALDQMDENDLNNECLICMERQPEIILPCTHCYCLVCIEQWSEYGHRWCPICHQQLQTTDDAWVIPDIPEQAEMSSYLTSLAE